MKRYEPLKWAIVLGALLLGAAGRSGSIYYKSQKAADEALARFDMDNPKCQLWTNWQKMCSRTGKKRATFCASDASQKVPPSLPFCAVQMRDVKTGEYISTLDEQLQRQSRNRFCASLVKSNDKGYPDYADGRKSGYPVCENYKQHRPFNGSSLSAVKHPLCRKWLPMMEIKARAASKPMLLRCDEWRDEIPCPKIVGLRHVHDRYPESASDKSDVGNLVMLTLPVPTSSAVWGVHCYPDVGDQK
jgi:hypothetical protein